LPWNYKPARIGKARARNLGTVTVTNNPKDFGRVKGLKVQNWLN